MIKNTRFLRAVIWGLCVSEVVTFYMGTDTISPLTVIALLVVAAMSEVGLILEESKPKK